MRFLCYVFCDYVNYFLSVILHVSCLDGLVFEHYVQLWQSYYNLFSRQGQSLPVIVTRSKLKLIVHVDFPLLLLQSISESSHVMQV